MVRDGAVGGQKVYNRVRVLRAEMDLTRQELADELGIGYRTLGYIEREQYTPSLEMAWKVCAFFELPTDAVWSPEPFGPMHGALYGGQGGAEGRADLTPPPPPARSGMVGRARVSGGSSMHGDERPTREDVEAMKLWPSLEGLGPRAAGAGTIQSDGHMVVPGPTTESAREVEESLRDHEERHAEGRAWIVRAIGGALGLSHAVGFGPWASPSVRARVDRGAGGQGGRGEEDCPS